MIQGPKSLSLSTVSWWDNREVLCSVVCIMVVSRDMYYMCVILKRHFGKFMKLTQINERKILEDLGD